LLSVFYELKSSKIVQKGFTMKTIITSRIFRLPDWQVALNP